MDWWRNYTALKHARQMVKGTRKLLRMHRDILAPDNIRDIGAAADDLAGAVNHKQPTAVNALIEKLDRQLERAFPRRSFASLRENVEVFLVAAIVAMAVRTFFIQPFKIPTGSMQPTLYGIYPSEPNLLPYPNGVRPSWPEMIFGIAWHGRIYEQFGYRSRGDHIFVDRFTYHFRKPDRGEVIVFDTADIEKIPESSRGKFYIKRLIGVAADTVQIQPPHVLVNGEPLNSRAVFKQMYAQENAYPGYVLPRGFPPAEVIQTEHDVYEVPAKHLFVLGDNSPHSLDGRFWGSVHEKALVGRAVFVYWPFSHRFGNID